ncbi:hypothetical protein MTO96_010433 [Rhipicephalus appendiculatus]
MSLLGAPVWLLLAVTLCALLYLYAARKRNYWKDQNIKYEPLSLLFAALKRLLLKPPHIVDQERYQKMGRLFGFFEGGGPILMVAEPDLIKLVLVKDFTSLPDRMMTDLIQQCAKKTAMHLTTAAETGTDMEMKQFYGHYAMDVITRCAFGTEVDSHSDKTNEFVTCVRTMISGGLNLRLIALSLTETEALAQCVQFFLAGLDSTSAVLAYTAYLLALNPDVQSKLRKEVDDCIKTHGNNPSLDIVSNLKYLHCVLSESLRMYPPAPRDELEYFSRAEIGGHFFDDDCDEYVDEDCPIKMASG